MPQFGKMYQKIEVKKMFSTVGNNNDKQILKGHIDCFKYFLDSDLINFIYQNLLIVVFKVVSNTFDREIK